MTRSALLRARTVWMGVWALVFIGIAALFASALSAALRGESNGPAIVLGILCAVAGWELLRSILVVQDQRSAMKAWMIPQTVPSLDGHRDEVHLEKKKSRREIPERSNHVYRNAADLRLEEAQARINELERLLNETEHAHRENQEMLEHSVREVEWLHRTLEKYTKADQTIHKIYTMGMPGVGKTSLTLKWASPLAVREGAPIWAQQYVKPVCTITAGNITLEHSFEITDLDGEYMPDALVALNREDVEGLLLVVDLGDRQAKTVDLNRIDKQLAVFAKPALKVLLGSIQAGEHLKALVLFINKSDLLSGTFGEVEAEAKRLYAPLIQALQEIQTGIDIRVIVGSAETGHNTHALFGHFTEKLIPKSAYDPALLRKVSGEEDTEDLGKRGAA